jgi:hypothetical protein
MSTQEISSNFYLIGTVQNTSNFSINISLIACLRMTQLCSGGVSCILYSVYCMVCTVYCKLYGMYFKLTL